MSLADGIVREFRSEIISSLVPPSNPPVARNGNKRSNGAYVRHEEYEDSTLIGIRRSPLRAARTVPDDGMNFYARRKNRFPSVPAIGISISTVGEISQNVRASKSVFSWHSQTEYLEIWLFRFLLHANRVCEVSDPSMTFEGGESCDKFRQTIHEARYWLQWTVRVYSF